MNTREFELAVLFSLTELATLCGVSRKRLLRLLETNGVKVLRAGRRFVVSRVALSEALPDVYEGLRERVRNGGSTADDRVVQ